MEQVVHGQLGVPGIDHSIPAQPVESHAALGLGLVPLDQRQGLGYAHHQ